LVKDMFSLKPFSVTYVYLSTRTLRPVFPFSSALLESYSCRIVSESWQIMPLS